MDLTRCAKGNWERSKMSLLTASREFQKSEAHCSKGFSVVDITSDRGTIPERACPDDYKSQADSVRNN